MILEKDKCEASYEYHYRLKFTVYIDQRNIWQESDIIFEYLYFEFSRIGFPFPRFVKGGDNFKIQLVIHYSVFLQTDMQKNCFHTLQVQYLIFSWKIFFSCQLFTFPSINLNWNWRLDLCCIVQKLLGQDLLCIIC